MVVGRVQGGVSLTDSLRMRMSGARVRDECLTTEDCVSGWTRGDINFYQPQELIDFLSGDPGIYSGRVVRGRVIKPSTTVQQ